MEKDVQKDPVAEAAQEALDESLLRQKVLEANLHKAPSVGSVVNQVLAINPDLSAPEMMNLIRSVTRRQGSTAGDFASAEIIDVTRALELARATLRASH